MPERRGVEPCRRRRPAVIHEVRDAACEAKQTRSSHRREYRGDNEALSYAGTPTGSGPLTRVPALVFQWVHQTTFLLRRATDYGAPPSYGQPLTPAAPSASRSRSPHAGQPYALHDGRTVAARTAAPAPRPGHRAVAGGPPSLGESRHGLHGADPTSARHGVDGGRLDPTAAVTVYSNGSAGRPTYSAPPRRSSTPTAPDSNHPPAHGSRQELS